MIATRSSAFNVSKYSALKIAAEEEEEAWWPPTFDPSVLSRTLLAQWMMAVASHSTLSRALSLMSWTWDLPCGFTGGFTATIDATPISPKDHLNVSVRSRTLNNGRLFRSYTSRDCVTRPLVTVLHT